MPTHPVFHRGKLFFGRQRERRADVRVNEKVRRVGRLSKLWRSALFERSRAIQREPPSRDRGDPDKEGTDTSTRPNSPRVGFGQHGGAVELLSFAASLYPPALGRRRPQLRLHLLDAADDILPSVIGFPRLYRSFFAVGSSSRDECRYAHVQPLTRQSFLLFLL